MANQPVTPPVENAEIAKVTAAEKFIEYLVRRAEIDGENRSFDVAYQQVSSILVADTLEAMWDADERDATGGRDLVDVEQRIESFTVHPSSDQYKTALGHYMQVTSTRLSDGEQFTWDTSAPLLMGKLRWLESRELLPMECVIKGIVAGAGTVLKLRPIPSRAVKAEKQ
jgi:hypothetical protein